MGPTMRAPVWLFGTTKCYVAILAELLPLGRIALMLWKTLVKDLGSVRLLKERTSLSGLWTYVQ